DAEDFPQTETSKIITNQVLRSVASISANIAEGFGRRRGREYIHYLYISRGSANETLDWYEKLKRLRYISEEKFLQREKIINEIRAMLTGMLNKVS
ncbi:MAG: four helix bundle protein, partial [Proteobacteria bacterium]|nr:four helix bundle protein [Pseudomonadota bacterium]